MDTVTIEEAQANLPELIKKLIPGEAVVITRDQQPVARLIGDLQIRQPRQAGNCQGLLSIVADDNEHLSDWAEYLP